MESERTQNFHDRLNQWVASQGFWFQLRYSMAGSGMRGSGFYHFLRLLARAIVFLAVVALIGVVYLIKRSDTDAFRDKLERSIVAESGAAAGKMDGFQRVQGKLSIARFSATGRESSFFTTVDLRDVGCRMGIFDGLFGPVKPGVITAAKMDINLRAGTPGPEAAAHLGDVLFKSRPDVEITALEVEEATVGWGYSEFNRGLLRDSHMNARRRDMDWWIQFKGGTFTQNWLRDLEVEEIEVVCGPGGLRFDKFRLRKGNGSLDLSGMMVTGKERPEISGTAKLKNLPLAGMLPELAEPLLEGLVSGNLKVSGSTNSQEGIAFDGKISLGEGDGLMIRDRIPLLKALRMVDVFNNYRRVNFQTGTFQLKTGGGRLEISNADLEAGDLMTLQGGLVVRQPSKEEKAMPGGAQDRAASLQESDQQAAENVDFSLKRAGAESRKKDEKAENAVIARYEMLLEERDFAEQMAAKIAQSLRYEGEFVITLRADAFDQSPKLKAEFPPNAKGRIPLKVPLQGTLGVLTVSQAEEISAKGKR